MSDLAQFLLDRISEDEVAARAATAGPWRYNPEKAHRGDYEESVFTGPAGAGATTIASTGPMDDPQSMADAEHIARWDPARVLAECAAKRRIVEMAQRFSAMPDDSGTDLVLDDVLRLLALPYADHPEYDPAWRPEENPHQ